MKRIAHWWNYLTSKSYRKHYWLSKHLSKYKLAWMFVPIFLLWPAWSTESLEALRHSVGEGRRRNRIRKVLDEVIAKRKSYNDT